MVDRIEASDVPTLLDHDAVPERSSRREGAVAAGGLLAALAASSCCILPLALFVAGIGGAWIGNLTALAPYQPVFIAVALGFLGVGFYRVYLRPRPACAAGESCARPLPNRIVQASLWLAAILVAAALAFPYAAPLLLDT